MANVTQGNLDALMEAMQQEGYRVAMATREPGQGEIKLTMRPPSVEEKQDA